MSEFPELDRLLSLYFEGAAAANDLAALEALLLADAEAVDHASRWCLMHRQIAELMTEDALHEIMDKFVQGTPGPPKQVFAAAQAASRPNAGAPQSAVARRQRRSWLVAAAAVVGVAAVAAAALWQRRGSPGAASEPRQSDVAQNSRTLEGEPQIRRPGVAPDLLQFDANQNNGTPVGEEIIATLTRLSRAAWAEGAAALSPGDQLAVGDRVALDSGMAKVTFECGAEIVLEGPCSFEIQSQMLGYLHSGKITADIPRRAFGFGILSPGVDFVDLGTSFGVNVGASGDTELHVFEGEVLCSPAAAQAGDTSEPIHVLANRAVTFAPAGAVPNDIAMDVERFSDLRALRRHTSIGNNRLLADRLALWLAADAAAATDDRGRVISWQDLIYGDNRSAEDAVQADEEARPLLVDDALHGRPAIRFDGESDWLLTTPLETTDDQTVFLVCQFSPSAYEPRRWGGQILNYDGPPSRYLSNLLEPGVLQIGEPLLEEQFRPTLVTSQVFAGFIGRATVEAGRVDGAEIGANDPVIICYVYDYGRRQAELFINGQSQGAARAFAPQGITSRKIIGRHAWMQNFFHGELAELLIYNKAMPSDELAATTAYLAEKYAIEFSAASTVLGVDR
jgi:hypothetical protein